MMRTPAFLSHFLPMNRNTLMARSATAWAVALLLGGCVNLAPNYAPPALPVPADLGNQATAGEAATTATVPDSAAAAGAGSQATALAWQDFFVSPQLRQVIGLALDESRDLRAAVLAMERARAQYDISRADLFPTVAATGAGNRTRTAQDLTTAGRSQITEQYSAQLGLSNYEVDFWGRVRNLNESALQAFFRVQENQRSARLALVADVANAWLTLAADQQRLYLARETLRTRQSSFQLTQRSHALGAISGLDLAQSQTTVDAARADVASFTALVVRDQNALNLLAGRTVPTEWLPAAPVPSSDVAAGAAAGSAKLPADAIDQATVARASTITLLPAMTPAASMLALPAQLPSSVLLQRPDIAAAENTLRGSYANIGAARAAFFPSITLTASVGTASNDLSGLFGGGNGTWSFLPQIRLPIFDAGRNRANLAVAQIDQQTALTQYEKTVQVAFREVADALADRATWTERLAAQSSLLQATERTYTLAQARYKAGADSYLTVLDAQRSLYVAQQTWITLQQAEQSNRVTLYKVLGGASS